MSSTTQALGVRCPRCKAAPEQPCRYVEFTPSIGRENWPSMQARVAKVGQPTVRPHNERFEAGRYKAVGLTRRGKRPLKVVVPSVVSPSVRAVRDLDLREFEQMREFLRANSRIFRVPGGN